MQQVIDVHTHVVPAKFPPSLRGRAGWPSMEPAQACHRNIMIDGKVYRTLSDRCWDVSKRVSDMDAMRVSVQVVSPMPELFSYWLSAPVADDLLHYINDQTAECVAASMGRLIGLAAVPLQDLDLAIAELQRARQTLGFAGVEVGSNVNGVPIGAAHFDSFFAEAERLDAAVFVHAVRPAGMDRLVGPKALEQVLGYPTDIGLAAASVITANTLERFPKLRIAFSHGGGTLACLLPRLDEAMRVFPTVREAVHEDVYTQARRLYYDALVYDEHTLRHLVATFGDTGIMAGTDYPFNFHERRPVERILQMSDDTALQEKLLYKNAERFLGTAGGMQ